MDNIETYLEKFESAVKTLDKNVLKKSGLEIQTGIWLNSAVLRLQKNIGQITLMKSHIWVLQFLWGFG